MSKHTPAQIQFIADSLMPSFIPKDENLCNLTFAFTADGCNYEVIYEKNKSGKWVFVSFQKA